MQQETRVQRTEDTGLQTGLKRRHLTMIGIGGVIGAGLFVGSGVVVANTGPASIISFSITGILVILVMRMLGEMAVARPAVGGFYEYSRLALGNLGGFTTGWMYWYYQCIVVAIEIVAGALLLQYWLPGVPLWVFGLALMVIFTLTNLPSVRSYGEFEFWFASIKVAAIVVFLFLGALFVLGLWPEPTTGLSNLTGQGGFAPNGILPILTGAVAATGFYFGAEIVTIAAAESDEPERNVARATNTVITRVLLFYVGSVFLVVCIVPWDSEAMTTPYVSALEVINIPAAAQIMNIVILTAVLSALNSALYASSRMLMALSRRGDAPQALAKVTSWGVPVRAILVGTFFGYIAVVMSYISPGTVFAFLVGSYGTLAIFVYVIISLSQLRMRRIIEREDPERLIVKMWLYPYLTYVTIAGMVIIVLAQAFIPEQRTPLLLGLASLTIILLFYLLRRKVGRPAEDATSGAGWREPAREEDPVA